MAFGLGFKVLNRFCQEQNPLGWNKAKLSVDLFKVNERPAFLWVEAHVTKFHALPQVATLWAQFPDLTGLETIEPATYYLDKLEHAFFYEQINQANIQSQNILVANHDDHEKAFEVMHAMLTTVAKQQYRTRIVDVGNEAYQLVMDAYENYSVLNKVCIFGWPYLDEQMGGGRYGDVISFVGRPAMGKTWALLWSAVQNFVMGKGHNVLFCSMEMDPLSITQRLAALYTGVNIGQLKVKGFSDQTFHKFEARFGKIGKELGKFYVIDGNLAASPEDVYALAEQLECSLIFIDGGYLLRNKNTRLDRFTRAAENVELMKRYSADQFCTVASWQFNREASKKQKGGKPTNPNLEDIGYSDAIGQISSVVLGMFQEEGIETMKKRDIRVMKGRNGEVGQFAISWNFNVMDFSQVDPSPLKEIDMPEPKLVNV